ncbi:MAG: flagellar export chaperone FliS [Planctomycetota bacterium]|jgi:flagellar protein FliS
MRGLDTYQEVSATTQNRGHLIVLLHDSAIKFLKFAMKGGDDNGTESHTLYINKALEIIEGLNGVLDMEAGGHAAVNLRKLYIFMTSHLNATTINKDAQKIDEVIKLLGELNQGWKAAT